MSIDIRYVTNGKKAIYRVIDSSAKAFNIYESKDQIPQNIRHYAPEGEPKFVDPDMAAIFGVLDVLYPNFPKCGHPDYIGKRCIAMSCKFAYPTYKDCLYFDKSDEAQVGLVYDSICPFCGRRLQEERKKKEDTD